MSYLFELEMALTVGVGFIPARVHYIGHTQKRDQAFGKSLSKKGEYGGVRPRRGKFVPLHGIWAGINPAPTVTAISNANGYYILSSYFIS